MESYVTHSQRQCMIEGSCGSSDTGLLCLGLLGFGHVTVGNISVGVSASFQLSMETDSVCKTMWYVENTRRVPSRNQVNLCILVVSSDQKLENLAAEQMSDRGVKSEITHTLIIYIQSINTTYMIQSFSVYVYL
jgi:hypothetical protein